MQALLYPVLFLATSDLFLAVACNAGAPPKVKMRCHDKPEEDDCSGDEDHKDRDHRSQLNKL